MQLLYYNDYYFQVIAQTAAIALGIVLFPSICTSQIVSDNSTSTTIQTSDNLLKISGGIQADGNLFHSFTEFSVPNGATASFANDLAIQNIFSRVTGEIASEIDGLLQTQGDASLFFLNPAGIVFGADAQLDIGGSFIATTGDRLIFADGVEFGLNNLEVEPLLTVSAPIGLQYGDNIGAIQILPNLNRTAGASGLEISPGNTLGLIGGEINIARNSLNAVGSNVEIGSVHNGTVAMIQDQYGWRFDYQNVTQLGQINLTDGALVNTSGRLHFHSQDINISDGSGITDFNIFGQEQSEINLQGSKTINLNGGLLVTQAGQQSDSSVSDQDISGNITIEAPQVSITNGAVVSAGTLGEGAGGNITITAPQSLILAAEPGVNPAIISTSTSGLGPGGQINVETGQLIIRNGSQIQALAGEGAGGTIQIRASQSIDIEGQGILRSVDFAGNLQDTELKSGVFASSGTPEVPLELQPQGRSGNLEIFTPQLNVKEQGQISVSNFGLADAGNITINASQLNLESWAEIVANTASGKGGSINITTQENLILDSRSSITTTAMQDGNGGNISILAKNLVLLEQNQISANAQQGNGGNININSQGIFINPSSSITASSEIERNQGNVNISTLDLNSRLNTNYQVPSTTIAEQPISKGCGININNNNNQFRDIGRGGISPNPLRETGHQELMIDLGLANSPNLQKLSDRQNESISLQQITEANEWQFNDQGIIELIAQQPRDLDTSRSHCGFNTAQQIEETS